LLKIIKSWNITWWKASEFVIFTISLWSLVLSMIEIKIAFFSIVTLITYYSLMHMRLNNAEQSEKSRIILLSKIPALKSITHIFPIIIGAWVYRNRETTGFELWKMKLETILLVLLILILVYCRQAALELDKKEIFLDDEKKTT